MTSHGVPTCFYRKTNIVEVFEAVCYRLEYMVVPHSVLVNVTARNGSYYVLFYQNTEPTNVVYTSSAGKFSTFPAMLRKYW